MKVLGHIHTFNDEDVVEACLEGVLSQTRPPDELVVIDNCSSDATLAKVAAVLVMTFVRSDESHYQREERRHEHRGGPGSSLRARRGLRLVLDPRRRQPPQEGHA